MKGNYKEIRFSLGSNIEDAVKELLEYKSKGVLVCGEFNGTMLHSDTVTFDGAYESIIGMSYAEFNKQQAESRERSRKAEEDWKEQLPENEKRWIEKGIKILSPDKHDIWRKMVPIRARDLYHGMELDASLAIVEVLNNGCSLDEAKHIIDEQGHSGMSFHLVLCMVRDLCARGGEFMSYAA